MTRSTKPLTFEFHISRRARDLYQFDDSLFTLSGNVILPNFRACRAFAQKMNEKRDLANFPERAVKAGQLNAMGLIDEILHYVSGLFREEKNPDVMREALDWLYERFGKSRVDHALRRFADEFPTVALYRREADLSSYLEGETAGIPNRQILLEEMMMLWLANLNPAFAPFLELFDDSVLESETSYPQIMESLRTFFRRQPSFGPYGQNLVEMLRSPAIAAPHSLRGQLDYIRERWGYMLGRYLDRLLSGLDLMKEEEMAELRKGAPWQRVPTPVYEYVGMEAEPERFSPDQDWMPRVVLLAKNVYVWLDQLSKKYRRPIHRLDQIPDEELEILQGWGISALWLIGIWERSPASKRIKRMTGNPEAEASAYAIFDYRIANDLGGEEAFQNLKERAWKRGIRMASDMVPNHVGIDGRWVMDHPDWFISVDESPYATYRFTGPDLSWHQDVGIYLEDHYFDRSDAAVVFKRVDRRNGKETYIYHGNDGTHMPWNDTAQLNYLKPEVREAIIQTILHVARQFPILRFDAAMTLTKRHYQRLWFPEPGTGGTIPSRAEHGMTRAEFNRQMPEEFWRQVVDRVSQEAPGTLLLAEAFWLLEGYFVRTLGMHRVYNSAFMNMLKDEENSKYRSVMKNTLEFNPEVLKRFVNFMSNPDEETAVSQFGKGDKYFGICTLMVTMPGLPMFAHGQIEGFAEKYGMEYRYAKWDEQPDWEFVRRHEREIFPLLKRRHLFADVSAFLLYDFFTPQGDVNEDVFAYSNCAADDRTLVIYHNRYASARGWIRTSAAYSVKTGEGEHRKLVQKTLGEGLGLTPDESYYTIFRDHVSGLEYIRNSRELCEKGLYVELDAYKYHVFVDFREIRDNEWQQYARVARCLNGRGTPNLQDVFREILQPVQLAFQGLVNPNLFRRLTEAQLLDTEAEPNQAILEEIEEKLVNLLLEVKNLSGGSGEGGPIAREVRRKLEVLLRPPAVSGQFPEPEPGAIPQGKFWIQWGWLFLHALGRVVPEIDFAKVSRSWIDEWGFGKIIAEVLKELGLDEEAAWRAVALTKCLTAHQRWFEEKVPHRVLDPLLKDRDVQQFLRINRYNGILWFNREAFDELLGWLMWLATIEISSDSRRPASQAARDLKDCYEVITKLKEAAKKSGYQVEKLFEALQ